MQMTNGPDWSSETLIIVIKVHMDLEDTKTKLSLMPSINVQNSNITSNITRVECWIGLRETKHVLNAKKHHGDMLCC